MHFHLLDLLDLCLICSIISLRVDLERQKNPRYSICIIKSILYTLCIEVRYRLRAHCFGEYANYTHSLQNAQVNINSMLLGKCFCDFMFRTLFQKCYILRFHVRNSVWILAYRMACSPIWSLLFMGFVWHIWLAREQRRVRVVQLHLPCGML